jgi:hypothetical protein
MNFESTQLLSDRELHPVGETLEKGSEVGTLLDAQSQNRLGDLAITPITVSSPIKS